MKITIFQFYATVIFSGQRAQKKLHSVIYAKNASMAFSTAQRWTKDIMADFILIFHTIAALYATPPYNQTLC